VSVHSYKTADGTRYRTCWREGKRQRARSFATKKEANDYDVQVKAHKLRGEVMPRARRETLASTYDEWLRLYAPKLSKNTLEVHEAVWSAHVKDRFDHHLLSELVANPQLFDELIAEMRKRSVGNASQRRVLAVLSSVMSAAVRWKKIPINPVLSVEKPPKSRKRIPHPMPPMVIERIRLRMLRRATLDPTNARNHEDACLVGLMSYAGMRPGEALALTWQDIGKRTIAVDKAVSVGEEAPTKTRSVRTVPMIDELAQDLEALRDLQAKPGDERQVFPGADGGLWSRWQFRNWRRRVWKPILAGLAEADPPQPTLASVIPYDCRASFVSLHLRAGENPLEVAEWAGHSPQVMFSHYAGVIKELSGEPVLPASEQIARARQAVDELDAQELDRVMDELMKTTTVELPAEPIPNAPPGPAAGRFFGRTGPHD
jgi:integrase